MTVMEDYVEQPPGGSSGYHPACKKVRNSLAGEKRTNPMGNDLWEEQPLRKLPHTPQSSSLDMMSIDDSIQLQEFGFHSHASQDWQTLVDDPNSGWILSHNAGRIQNSHPTGPGQLTVGAAHDHETQIAIGSYQLSSSGNLSAEDNTNCLPSNQPLPNGVMHDHETLDNDYIQNFDGAMAVQPGPSIPRDNCTGNTSAPNQLFNIIVVSPNWAFFGDQIKVHIIGRFLISLEEVQKYKWACVFGSLEVPAKLITEGVLECQTPSNGNGKVQLWVTCSNGFKCVVGEFEFRCTQVVDVGNDAGSSATHHFITRLQKLLYLEPSTSHVGVNSCSDKTLLSCYNVKKLLKNDSEWEKPVNFTKLVKSSPHNVKDQCIQNLLQEQLDKWLCQKICEGGMGANKLDREGQGVLHLSAALGYNWAIKPILDSGVICIDFQDVNQYTALDWASFEGRNDTVKLLESYGAFPRCAREPIHTNDSVVNPDIKRVPLTTKSQRLDPSFICGILSDHQQYTIETSPPIRPPSGSVFLFDQNTQRYFRNDGHKWRKKRRCHYENKGYGLKCRTDCGEENEHFRRGCYNRITGLSNIVLVHYWEEEKASESSSKHRSNWTGGNNSDDNPDLGREPDDNPPFGWPAVNQTSKSNGVNQMNRSNAGGLQNSYLNGPDRLLLEDTLRDVTSTECSSESSCDGNLHGEDNHNYSSSKQLLDGLMHDGFEMIDSLDCCSSNKLEDVPEKTIQPCLDANAGRLQNSYLNGPDRLLLEDTLRDVTSTECSSESSCDGNLHEEDNDNYSSSKQLLLDGLMHDGFEMIDSLDCCVNNQLEDDTEKTIQPCIDAHKGTVESEDGDDANSGWSKYLDVMNASQKCRK